MTDKGIRSGKADIVQKQAGKAVRERQTRFRRISAITSDIAYSCHTRKDGGFSLDWITGAADRITGYSIEEIKAHGSFRFLVIEEDIPLFEKNVIGLAPGSRGSCELRIRHKNGNTVWISSFAECVAAAKIPGRLLYGGLTDITDRKQAEEKLSASEARYRRLFEAAKDGILILDADTGMIVDVNASLTEMLGFSRDEFLGKNVWDLGFFKGIVASQADFLKLQQKEYIRYEDMALDTADGRRINVEFVSNLYPVGQGKVIQCSIRGAHLASFPAQNPYPVVEVGIDGAVRFANPAAMATLARLGVEPDARQFLPGTPEELVLLQSHCEQNPQTQELRLGGATFLRVVAAPPGGDSLHVYVIDITERKQAEDKLQVAQLQWGQVLDLSPDPMWIKDASGRYVAASKSYYHFDPSAAGNIIGKTDAECFQPEKATVYVADDRIAIETGASEGEFPAVGDDGKLRTFLTKKVILRAPDGSVAGTLGVSRDITDRKRADEALRDSENKYRLLVENSHDIIYMLDLQGIFTFASPSWKQLLGQNNDAVVGHRFQEFVHPDDIPSCEKFLASLLEARGSLPGIEYRIRNVEGEWKWYNTNGAPIINADGTCTSVVGIASDITERKQAAERLASQYALLQAIINSSGDVIVFSLDAQYCYTAFNDKHRREMKKVWSVDVQIGMNMLDCMNIPEFRALAKQGMDRALRGESFLEEQYQANLDIYYEFNWNPVMQGKDVVGVAVFTRDITERKKKEEESQRERAFFDQLVETAPEGIAIADPQGRVMRVNAEFVCMFGYGVDEVVGQYLDDLVAPPARQEEAKALTRSTIQGGKNLLETVRRRKDGTLVDVSLIGASIVIAGKQEAVYAIYRDITERKQLEAQLRQSQKMEAIGQLAGGIAHDFNNLLTGILGNIALMRSTLPSADPLLENLDGVETAARQATTLTKGLLTFSRSAVVLPVPINLTAALDATLALLKQSLPATMEIVHGYEQTAWNVLVDQSQITQILFNLAVNARDAMDGKGTLIIRARNEVVREEYVQTHPFARTGEFVHLSVTDTGPGIPPAILEHLFEPFHTTKLTGSGTGLGLSIVYGAVKQADGWITGVSTEGVGTTFDIYLPRCLEEPTQPFIPSPLSVNAGSGTVLVVEDEPIVCAVAQALLSRSGYTVLTAPDGASALNVLRDHLADIELILLDMTMPGMTTVEIVQGIRLLDPAVPILLNSGYASNNTVKQMLDEGTVQGFLGKPYTLGELVGKVQELLRRR